MKNFYKYLFFLILGITIFILLNSVDRFSVGVPGWWHRLKSTCGAEVGGGAEAGGGAESEGGAEAGGGESDDELTIAHLDLIDKDRYRFCIITLDTFTDGHFLVVIKDLSNNFIYTLGYGRFLQGGRPISTGFQDIAYIGAYSSPNSYTSDDRIQNIFEHGYPKTERDLDSYLHIPWVDLEPIKRDAATILGWNENIWNLILVPFRDSSALKEHIDKNANTDNYFDKSWDELTGGHQTAADVLGYSKDNWSQRYYLSQPTKYVKLRKVIDWSELSDIQFKFLKLLKNHIEGNQIKFLNFLTFGLKSGIDEDEFIEWIDGERLNHLYLENQRQDIIFSDDFLCDCAGCCLDGTAIFLSDNTILNKVEAAGLLDEFNSL